MVDTFEVVKEGEVIRFHTRHLVRIEGDLEYMKKYQKITVDKALLEGA